MKNNTWKVLSAAALSFLFSSNAIANEVKIAVPYDTNNNPLCYSDAMVKWIATNQRRREAGINVLSEKANDKDPTKYDVIWNPNGYSDTVLKAISHNAQKREKGNPVFNGLEK